MAARLPSTELAREYAFVNLARETMDPRCLELIRPRDAWDNLILPLRMQDGYLVCATTEETLPAAHRFVQHGPFSPCRFVIAEIRQVEQFIACLYGYEGVDIEE